MRLLSAVGLIATVSCRTDKSITIQNPAPKADIFSHSDGDTVLEGFATTFVGNVTDANHTPDQLRTIWYLDGDVVCEELVPDEAGQTQCDITLDTESSEIALAVLDLDNARGETSILVSVEPTEAPVAEIVTPSEDGVYYSDQLITFEGALSDAEDDAELLTAFWESNLDGVLSDIDTEIDSTGVVIGYGYLTEGEHAIELHVDDSTGKTARETVIIDVGPPNSPPLCQIASPLDDSAGPEGDVITFEATAEDVDVAENVLTAEWSSDKDGVIGTSTVNTDGTITFPYSGLSVDTHVVTLTVEDEVEAACTSSVVFTVGTPPSITIDSPLTGDVVGEGTPISFMATVSDAQDQSDNVSLEWVVNGNIISTQGATSTGEALFTYGALSYGTYNLVVTATDTDGLTDSDQVNFTINGLPSAPVISINPSTPTTSDGLNLSIDSPSIDPEGLTPTYTYEWQVGGQAQTLYTSSTLPSSATTKGEQWTVIVTPNDGIADGVAGMTSVVIGNTAPSVGSVTLTPTGAIYNDDLLTCAATVTDLDETPVTTYEWMMGGSVVGTGSTLDLSTTGGMPGEAVMCTVTATDSDLDTDSNSASQTISNRSPSITASISSNGTNQNAEITCIGIATDPDGETPTVTYEWFNGSTSLGSSNPLQLSSTLASSGDVIDCVATATDGVVDTDTATVSHTVTNSAPILSSVTVTPNPATVGQDDLTCSVSGSDADGDALLYSYEWSDSTGIQQTTTLVSDTTDVFLANGLTEDTWTCEVTPFDGIDYGSPISDSVSVQNGCTSLSFDGTSHRVQITHPNLPGGNAPRTFTVWAYIENQSDLGNLFTYGNADFTSSNERFSLIAEPGSGSVRFAGQNNDHFYGTPISLSAWHHFALTFDGSVLALFIDGALTNTATTTLNTAATYPLIVGSNTLNRDDEYFAGMISNLTVWDRALSSTEVLDDVMGAPPVSPLANWRFGPNSYDAEIGTVSIVNEGAVAMNECPDEDVDGDGYSIWEDCDDTDPAAWDYGSGTSSSCPAVSCKTILDDGYSTGDGMYWLNPDGSGAYLADCVMSTFGGGWTALLSTTATDTYFGNNSPNWSIDGTDSATGLTTTTAHFLSYGKLITDEIALCYQDTSACYIMDHNQSRTLQSFFTQNSTYSQYSSMLMVTSDVGSSSELLDFEQSLGIPLGTSDHASDGIYCDWIGINLHQSTSAIGWLRDENGGCSNNIGFSSGVMDDGAVGIGMNSCYDNNGCYPGGTGNSAGRWRNAFGQGIDASGDAGPWFVLGR